MVVQNGRVHFGKASAIYLFFFGFALHKLNPSNILPTFQNIII